jgi:hypothetical protein
MASYHGDLEVVGALLAARADVEAKTNVSMARAWALCPSLSCTHVQDTHGCLQGMYLFTCLAVSQDGASAPRLEQHSEYAPESVRRLLDARHAP